MMTKGSENLFWASLFCSLRVRMRFLDLFEVPTDVGAEVFVFETDGLCGLEALFQGFVFVGAVAAKDQHAAAVGLSLSVVPAWKTMVSSISCSPVMG